MLLQGEFLTCGVYLHLSGKTDQRSLLISIFELHLRCLLIEHSAGIAKMLHGAIGRGDNNFAAFMRVGAAKDVAFRSHWLFQNTWLSIHDFLLLFRSALCTPQSSQAIGRVSHYDMKSHN